MKTFFVVTLLMGVAFCAPAAEEATVAPTADDGLVGCTVDGLSGVLVTILGPADETGSSTPILQCVTDSVSEVIDGTTGAILGTGGSSGGGLTSCLLNGVQGVVVSVAGNVVGSTGSTGESSTPILQCVTSSTTGILTGLTGAILGTGSSGSGGGLIGTITGSLGGIVGSIFG